MQFKPTDSLVIDLAIQHEESDGPVSLQQLNSRAVVVDLISPGNNQTTEVNKTYGDSAYDGEAETTLFSARINWDVSESMSFRSVTGYVDHNVTSTYDADATDALFVNLVDAARPSESWSQEFNLYGGTDRLEWLVGAFYFKEDFSLALPVEFVSTALGIPGDPFPVPVLAGDLEEETESYALFTDLTLALTDRFRVNAGLRYNAEKKEFTYFGAPSGDTDETDWLPKIGVQFDASDNVNLYASYQKGIKSGGHQLGAPEQFAPEELDSYEIGLKSTLVDGKLTANAAIFFYDYADLQATTTIPPATTVVRNADAEILGGEMELVFSPNEAWNFNFGLSLLDSQYKDFAYFDEFSMQAIDLDGEPIIRAPEYTLNFGAQWVIPISADFLSDITLRGDLYHSDEYKLTFIDYPETRQGSYTTGNLSVIFTSASEQVRLRGFVDNLGDEEVLNNGSYLATLGAFIGYYSEPRTYGIELLFDF